MLTYQIYKNTNSNKRMTLPASTSIPSFSSYTEVTFTNVVRLKWPSSLMKQGLLLLGTAAICSDPARTVR